MRNRLVFAWVFAGTLLMIMGITVASKNHWTILLGFAHGAIFAAISFELDRRAKLKEKK